MIKFGVIKEGKIPPDERVPLTPKQIHGIQERFSKETNWRVQSSTVRRIKDAEYLQAKIQVAESVNDCDVIVGVKEVQIDDLVPGKTHMFFSHTIKMQPYNKGLLQAVLEKKVTLIDWECLTDASGRRLIGFGRYAGIVGTYNAFIALGKLRGLYELKKAQQCEDRVELESQLASVDIPPVKILLTGRGKVAKGAMEVLDFKGIRKVGIRDYIYKEFDEPVYCQVTFQDYFKPKDGGAFSVKTFYNHPELFESDFMRFAKVSDVFIAGHYWDSASPFLFTREDARKDDFNIQLVADISCDIDGPVASTIRPSTIADPRYGYDPKTEKEVAFGTPGSIGVMAVDNLPCELPRDASHDFGEMFIKSVLPSFLNNDKSQILKRGTIAKDGKITEAYSYLKDWVKN